MDSHCIECGDNKKGGCSCPRPQADGDATGRHSASRRVRQESKFSLQDEGRDSWTPQRPAQTLPLPDANCVTRADGACVSEKVCMHTPKLAPEHRGLTLQDNPSSIDGGGYKASMDDPKKLPLWLVPVALIRGTAAVMQYGARKYAANNWRRGMAYSEVYSALQRHLTAWADGEDNDGETNLSHLWHAACCLAFLIEYVAFSHLYAKFDDRFKRPNA